MDEQELGNLINNLGDWPSQFTAIVYYIWKARNMSLFSKEVPDGTRIMAGYANDACVLQNLGRRCQGISIFGSL